MSSSTATISRLNWLRLFRARRPRAATRRKALTLFGTRPEAIKLAPVIRGLEAHHDAFQTINVASGQHTDLLYPFVKLLGIRIDRDLHVMSPDQTPNQVCARVLEAMDVILEDEQPDLILVQGDTTTALAGALAGFHRKIAVGHVEAGLRSGNPRSPYPEEMNRRMITRLATYHFAATARNRLTLLAEGIEQKNIFVTGNPVVDSLKEIIKGAAPKHPALENLIEATRGLKRVVLTTHRRESFGELMTENLLTLRRFVETREDVALIFPVHPNPAVVTAARTALSSHPRIHLIEPLGYEDFIGLLSAAWLIVSDSGGVQEEAPTLGKPLLVLRENTERPEALESGVARLVGGSPLALASMLEEAYADESWAAEVLRVENPFGKGDSGERIAEIIAELLNIRAEREALAATV
ncbi:MAG TPA: UDP-N-acetylglucosamine 2-epimerase (non-hydrolyzing) [Pyrinomonadaceae bacterium]